MNDFKKTAGDEDSLDAKYGKLSERIKSLFPGLDYQQMTDHLTKMGFTIKYETVRRYCVGERRPEYEFLVNLARLKKVSVDWLLTGESTVEPPFNASDKEFWLKFAPNEADALREFAQQRDLTVADAAHWLVRDGLYRFENLRNPRYFEFFPKSAARKTVRVPIWGSIHDNEFFRPQIHTLSAEVPIEVQPEAQREDKYPDTCFHAYLIETDDFTPLGILRGHLIIAGNRPLTGASMKDEGNPILLKTGAGSRLLLRRFFFDYIKNRYFVFVPLTGTGRVERHEDTDGNDMENVFGIVTP